ncbi:MAG: transglycosylase SLT domain-containing protein [Pyrinomonadaceae bacterium]|nr:transglycosylase SLT domain-containing protein [Pyrinomonadaceae bacterium]
MNYSINYLFSFKTFVLSAVVLVAASVFVGAQTTLTTANRDNSKTAQVKSAEERVDQITRDSGIYFKQGLYNLIDRRGSEARKDFDKSVEIFLMSGINVQKNAKLRECYSELIDTIYRMEIPNPRQPANVRRLSVICEWDVKDELASDVAKLVSAQPSNAATAKNLLSSPTTKSASQEEAKLMQVGFSEQKFERSPRDELAKFEFTQEEIQQVDTPQAKQEYDILRIAVERNRSLGFGFQMHPKVQQFLNYYRGRGRRTMEVGLYRSGMFMSMARRIFVEEGIPANVAWLGQVESAWKPTAHSWAAAAGLWQFIPGTGRRYGLRRTAYLDERQSFEKATRASARYLKFLANRYGGNWELAIGAYNCGEGNVDKAIRRSGRRNFWAAYPYLPRETRNYVPNILATIIIANNPHKYGFGHIRPARPLNYDRIRVPSSTRLSLIAQASDTSVQYLRYLNPELRSNVSPPEPYIVRIPRGKANNVVSLFRKVPTPRTNTARLASSSKGETWTNISRRTGVSVADLRRANPGMKAPTGRVIVPIKGNGVKRTNYSRPKFTPTGKRIQVVLAKSGETVEQLAKRYKASPVEVAKFNGLLVTSRLNKGREIRLPAK